MAGLLRSLKNSVPSTFTMLNLLSGCMAVMLSFHDIALAGLMVLVAGVFDFADGLAARLLGAYSNFGRELDSLADIVSFGVAPSFILFHLLRMSLVTVTPVFSLDMLSGAETIILATSFMPVIFAAIRLAMFNLSQNQDDVFSGLPSPAAGIFIASAGYILFTTDTGWIQQALLNTGVLLSMGIILSLLMVVPLPMFNIKFNHFRFTGNRIRYLFVLPSILLLVWLGIMAIPVIIIWYILLSLILVFSPEREDQRQPD